jgi:PAS domain S-box-containing protein
LPKSTFLAGGGEAGALVRSFDWSGTALGRPETWPDALRTALAVCLNSAIPSAVYWGRDFITLYNDAWAQQQAGRHPWAMGRPGRESRADIWDTIRPQFEDVVASGRGFSTPKQMLPIQRAGGNESWWSYSIVPLYDSDGHVGGLLTQGFDITAQVLAQQHHAREIDRFREMFRQAPGAVAILSGPEHVYEIANESYLELVGRRDVLGKTLAQALPEIVEQGFVALMDKVYETGEPFVGRGVEVTINRGDTGEPERRHVDFVYQPIRNNEGIVTDIFVEATDVTERVMSEAVLRESEERFRLVADSAPVMLWMGDQNGKCLYLNRAQRRFWGVAEQDVPAFNWNTTVHPEDIEALSQPFSKGMKEQIGFSAEARYRRSDGEWRTLRTNAHPRFDTDGEFVGMIGVNVDVTEIREAELALAESEARFRGITNSIEQMIWSTLPDGYHDFYNDRWYEYTGVPKGSTDGEAWNGMFHPDDQERAWGIWRHSLDTGEPYHIEYRLRHRSGQYRWVLGRAQAVRDEAGRIVRWFGTCTDIQEIVEAREVLARSREELEAAVEERTAKLMEAESQLRQSQKMEAIGQLTGGIAHDFNNMLAVVMGGLNLLQRRLARGDTDVGRYIEGAMEGARRAAALTSRLLAFSRLQQLAPEQIDANKLVQGMTDLLARTLGEAIKVETVLSAGLWRTFADVNQLESALLNLAVNARDAMPDGGRLTIETANAHIDEAYARENELAPGQYVLIAVTDTGVGMTPDVVAKAFDPFFTTKAVGKGTGLGLSQVFGFIRQSGGHVKIYSEVGQGTSVKIYLPRNYSEAQLAERREKATDAAPGSGEVVLVVEDEERVRAFSVDTLRELGYSVIEARSAAEALRLLESTQEVSLLFTDVVMPEMNGRQLVDRAREVRPDLKVLYTTGYTRNAIVHNGVLDSGANLLVKPFTIDQLAAKVRHVLDS